jgi:[ribosomal protein S5]-alanine N-acetyltransferase
MPETQRRKLLFSTKDRERNPFLEDENIPEIEWTISPDHWGNGYATEIGRAMLTYGFAVARFPAIMGFALPQHKASRRVMENK